MNYYEKYLKYKTKYLRLKNKLENELKTCNGFIKELQTISEQIKKKISSPVSLSFYLSKQVFNISKLQYKIIQCMNDIKNSDSVKKLLVNEIEKFKKIIKPLKIDENIKESIKASLKLILLHIDKKH